jgi:hypothetical protein
VDWRTIWPAVCAGVFGAAPATIATVVVPAANTPSLVRYDEWSQESAVGSRREHGGRDDETDVITVEEAMDIVSLAAEVMRAGVAATSYLVLSGPVPWAPPSDGHINPRHRLLTGHEHDPPRRTAGSQEIPASDVPRLAERMGEGRKLLTFSDSRQDAAFFASYLDRTSLGDNP